MRLIDADDFKKFLQALCKVGAPYEEVIQLLDNQPTACDVEAVVAELEKEITIVEGERTEDIPIVRFMWNQAVAKAISIVRGKE